MDDRQIFLLKNENKTKQKLNCPTEFKFIYCGAIFVAGGSANRKAANFFPRYDSKSYRFYFIKDYFSQPEKNRKGSRFKLKLFLLSEVEFYVFAVRSTPCIERVTGQYVQCKVAHDPKSYNILHWT